MPGILQFCWVVTIICVCIGAVFFLGACAAADSAIQESAAALIGIAFATIPYVFTKCIEALIGYRE